MLSCGTKFDLCDERAMEKRHAILIYNPRAGRGSARRRDDDLARFIQTLRDAGLHAELAATKSAGDATALAAQAITDGVTDIIVSGGDGTINEALQGLIAARETYGRRGEGVVRFGVLPRGTANVLAGALSLPRDTRRAAEIILNARTQSVFAGMVTLEQTNEHRYFLLMAGVGLDASVVRGVRSGLKRRVGEAAFWYSGIEHLARWQPVTFTVEANGETHQATFAALGKSPRYGGGLAITPRARLTDPCFEICIVKTNSRFRYLRLLGASMRNGLSQDTNDVSYLIATEARAEGDALVQVDGELIGTLPARFEISPHPVEIIVP